MEKRKFLPGKRLERHSMATIYRDVYEAVQEHCLRDGRISVTEFINSTLAEALGVEFVRSKSSRPYYPRDHVNPLEDDVLRVRKIVLGRAYKGD